MANMSAHVAYRSNGSADFSRGDIHAHAHAGHINPAAVRGTESVSAHSEEEFSDLFDWDKYENDVSTVTSVTDHGDHEMKDAPPMIVQLPTPRASVDAHVTSGLGGGFDMQPPRPGTMDIEEQVALPASSLSPASIGDQHPRRVLRSPEATNRVRKMRSCHACKLSKIACDDQAVCANCMKDGRFSHDACNRALFSEIPRVDRSMYLPPKLQGTQSRHDPYKCLVFLSPDLHSYRLEVTPSYFKRQGNSGEWLGVHPDHAPSEKMMLNWMRVQIQAEKSTEFAVLLDKLQHAYVISDGLGQVFQSVRQDPNDNHVKHARELLSSLLDMRCMWKIWSTTQFFFRTQQGLPIDNLVLSPIQDHIHGCAEANISSLEWNILRLFDGYLVTSGPKIVNETVRNAFLFVKWLSLWQIILTYRQTLKCMEEKQAAAIPAPVGVNCVVKRSAFREETQTLLNAFIVLYSKIFNKKSTLQAVKKAGSRVFGNDGKLYELAKVAWAAQDKFCDDLQRDNVATDQFLIATIASKNGK